MSLTKAQKKRINKHVTEMAAIAAIIMIVWIVVAALKSQGY